MNNKPKKTDSELQTLLAYIGNKIQSIREAKGITTAELSETANVTRAYLYKIESGEQNLSIDKVQSIADALKIPIISLFPESNEFNISDGSNEQNRIIETHEETVNMLTASPRFIETRISSMLPNIAKFFLNNTHLMEIKSKERSLDQRLDLIESILIELLNRKSDVDHTREVYEIPGLYVKMIPIWGIRLCEIRSNGTFSMYFEKHRRYRYGLWYLEGEFLVFEYNSSTKTAVKHRVTNGVIQELGENNRISFFKLQESVYLRKFLKDEGLN